MQGMKQKVQDMTSTVKEKVKEGTANVQGTLFVSACKAVSVCIGGFMYNELTSIHFLIFCAYVKFSIYFGVKFYGCDKFDPRSLKVWLFLCVYLCTHLIEIFCNKIKFNVNFGVVHYCSKLCNFKGDQSPNINLGLDLTNYIIYF